MAAARRRTTREPDLYPRVERWLRQRHAFATATNAGLRLGRIDAVGLRDIGGDLTGTCEVIAVEVKAGNQPFATSAGQAHGYSVYAERCYLADVRSSRPYFSDDEIEIASRLSIGRLAIATSRIIEVLTAPSQVPVERLKLDVLDRLAWCRCTICESMFRRGSTKTDWTGLSRSSQRGGVLRAVRADRGFVYWLEEPSVRSGRASEQRFYRRRYVCPDCVQNLWGDFSETL